MTPLRWENAKKVEDAGGSLWRGGVIRDAVNGHTWARVSDESVVAGLTRAPMSERLAVWSGSYAQIDPDPSHADSLFDNHPRTWAAAGWSVFLAGIDNIEGRGVIIRPHAAHVISDIPSIARLMRERPAIGLLIDLEALTPPQIRERGDSSEFLRRVIQGFEALPRPVDAVIAHPALPLPAPPFAGALIEIGYSPV